MVNRLARAYISTKSYQKAQTVLDGLLQVHPGDSDARLAMGRLQMESKQFTKAMANFEALRLRNPFNPEIHHALESILDAQHQKVNSCQLKHSHNDEYPSKALQTVHFQRQLTYNFQNLTCWDLVGC